MSSQSFFGPLAPLSDAEGQTGGGKASKKKASPAKKKTPAKKAKPAAAKKPAASKTTKKKKAPAAAK